MKAKPLLKLPNKSAKLTKTGFYLQEKENMPVFAYDWSSLSKGDIYYSIF
jgi:hypothetical protein